MRYVWGVARRDRDPEVLFWVAAHVYLWAGLRDWAHRIFTGFLNHASPLVKDLDEAATNFRQVQARDSKHAGALSGLGRVAFEQKRYSDAIDLLQRAIARDDSLREAHMNV